MLLTLRRWFLVPPGGRWGLVWLVAGTGLLAPAAWGQVPVAGSPAPSTTTAAAAAAAAGLPPDSAQRRTRRLPWLVAGTAASYGIIYTGLTTVWYSGERVPLHWFNDLPEWQQLDKCGHVWGAFQESRAAVDMLRWAGLPEKKAIWYGAFVGFAVQSPIEILDGFDPAYGASATDLAANFLGSAGVLGQQLAWHDIRLLPKLSFRLTPYAAQRPNVLGSNLPERLLKDYNGQTYWLCADLQAFSTKKLPWPRWLQPALGYGGRDMVYNDDGSNAAQGLRPYRQFYLSLDVDLRRIPTRSPLLKKVFYTLSIFHLPAPALEINGRQGVVGHWLF
jgi:Predicted periplasmic lipoprotein (DUF2279)